MSLNIQVNTARAVLGAAQTFKHPHSVIWEYVVNEIQYREKRITPKIYVEIDKSKIIVSGNGSGMDYNDLIHFFTLHAENRDRKKGNPGRGKFGTGKSAAFAIANNLKITTIKKMKEFEIKLSYENLKKFSDTGKDIPLDDYIAKKGIKTKKNNGTIIEISNFFKGVKINTKEIIAFLEKNLKYFKGAEVWVNQHLCQSKEPETKKTYIFNSLESNFTKLGDIDLVIKVAAEPLDKNDIGISIISNQTHHEITLAGSENRDLSDHIFGEINCPNLDDDDEEPAAFNMSRDGKLNPQNSIVRDLHIFIGLKVEEVRKQLVIENDQKRKSEEAKKLQEHADKIAEVINDHFKEYMNKIKINMIRKSDGKNNIMPSQFGDQDHSESISLGDELHAILTDGGNLNGYNDTNTKNSKPIFDKKKVKNLKDDEKNKAAKKNNNSGKKNSSGGNKFKVEYCDNGKKNPRAIFVSTTNTVQINLENPYISKLKNDTQNEDTFKKIANEIAFTEYAMGLVRMLHNNKYFKDNTEEYLQELRIIVNALSLAMNG